MRPSIARDSGQLDPRCSTTAPPQSATLGLHPSPRPSHARQFLASNWAVFYNRRQNQVNIRQNRYRICMTDVPEIGIWNKGSRFLDGVSCALEKTEFIITHLAMWTNHPACRRWRHFPAPPLQPLQHTKKQESSEKQTNQRGSYAVRCCLFTITHSSRKRVKQSKKT